MFKRTIVVSTVMMVVFSLVACGAAQPQVQEAQPQVEEAAQQLAETAAEAQADLNGIKTYLLTN
jgi:hypothetical protein